MNMNPSDLEMSAVTSLRPSFQPVPAPSTTNSDPPSQNFDCYLVESTPTKRMRLNCNVSIRVENRVFKCDRAVLSKHCEYFGMMFRSGLKESSICEICLGDYVDVGTFEQLLKSFYSGRKVEITDENVFLMLWNSSYLIIPDVVKECVAHVLRRRDHMRVDDVLKVYVFSRSMNLVSLVDRLHGCLLQHFFDLSRCDSFFALPFDEMIRFLTEYKLMASSKPFDWKHGEIYSLDILVRYMKRSLSERRPPSELEELIKMINFSEIPAEFAQFMITEFKFRFPVWTAWRRTKPRVESDLRTFIRNTKDEVIDEILPRFRAIDSEKIPPIHAVVQKSKSMSVYSISRLEPSWSVTLSTEVPPKFHAREDPVRNSWVYRPFKAFQCFTLKDDYSSVYCLKNVETSRGIAQTFQVGSSLDIFSNSTNLAAPPKFLTESDVCQVKTDMYFYEPCPPYGGSYENVLSKSSNRAYQDIRKHDISCYNRDCNKWFRVSQPEKRQMNACMTADKTLVYLIGGWCNGEKLVQAYDRRTPRWFHVAKTAHFHKEAACCCLNGKVYVFNGSEMERYVPTAGKWEVVNLDDCYYLWSLGEPRRMLPYGNQLWFFTYFSGASGKVFVYDTVSGKSFVNTLLMDTIRNDCDEDFAVRSVLVHCIVASDAGTF